MLSELCHELKNWFDRGQPKFIGGFDIVNGKIINPEVADRIQDGQYFRIIGSVFNDGVYCFNNDIELHDETFHGAIWFMAVPNEIIDIAIEIKEWQTKYGNVNSSSMSPYNSESFAGYSYSKDSGESVSWQKVFANRIKRWRKI